jgi:hypothetical protein
MVDVKTLVCAYGLGLGFRLGGYAKGIDMDPRDRWTCEY